MASYITTPASATNDAGTNTSGIDSSELNPSTGHSRDENALLEGVTETPSVHSIDASLTAAASIG